MAAEPLAFEPVCDLLNRSRALQEATAAATAQSRAVFARLLEIRAAVGAQINALRWADGCPTSA
jgi:hypothetical protein